MTLSTKLSEAFNAQVNAEMWSANLYLSMAVYFKKEALNGFASWMEKQAEEELEHAMKLFDYIQGRQGCVQLKSFECPNYEIHQPLEAFKIAYDLEVANTKNIHAAYALALQKNVFALVH